MTVVRAGMVDRVGISTYAWAGPFEDEPPFVDLDMQLSQPNDLPQTQERRGFIRYVRKLEMLWSLLGVSSPDLTSGLVCDLSARGVGLVLDREFPLGATLMLRLPTARRGWSTHLARVRRCTPVAPESFQVGCAFVKPLSAGQLQALLE